MRLLPELSAEDSKQERGEEGLPDDDDGPALDFLSRPEIWKKKKSRTQRAIRKLATDVVKLQARIIVYVWLGGWVGGWVCV